MYYPPSRTPSDRPISPERSALEPTDCRTAPEGRQTIRNQYAVIPSFPNHVMYVSWPIAVQPLRLYLCAPWKIRLIIDFLVPQWLPLTHATYIQYSIYAVSRREKVEARFEPVPCRRRQLRRCYLLSYTHRGEGSIDSPTQYNLHNNT